MRIDLHTHSTASDGTDTPAQLMQAAARAGLDVVAITDHDTTGGWQAAADARPTTVTLIRGCEFSTAVAVGGRSVSVHLLGYLFDPHDPAIVAESGRLVAERLRRGLAIVDKMAAGGLPISRQQVLDLAAGAPIGRPHIARALIAAGLVNTVSEAFASYLSGRGPYYVPKRDTDLTTAVAMVTAAGGAAVIAHPRGRGEYRALTRERIGELRDAGLVGLELDHTDHDGADRAELRSIADEFGLLVTGSSDYHGENKPVRLGAHLTALDALHRLVAATSGVTPAIGEAVIG